MIEIEPFWTGEKGYGIPWCRAKCPYNKDGRCGVSDFQVDDEICHPAIKAMSEELKRLRDKNDCKGCIHKDVRVDEAICFGCKREAFDCYETDNETIS